MLLFNNKLTGRIPKLNNLLNIDKIRLENNNLTRSIPAISNLSKLKFIHLNDNKLEGSLPTFYSYNKNLPRKIYISNDNYYNEEFKFTETKNNAEITIVYYDNGYREEKRIVSYKKDTNYIEIPDHNFKISIYQEVRIEGLEGYTYITSIENNENIIEDVNLSNNNLKGYISNINLGNLINLKSLILNNNQLNGNVDEILKLKILNNLDLSHNNFTGEFPFNELQKIIMIGQF